jgi:hypothetical protein
MDRGNDPCAIVQSAYVINQMGIASVFLMLFVQLAYLLKKTTFID